MYQPKYMDHEWEKEVNSVIDKVDKSWNKDQIIFYLVSQLSPFFQRDLNFFLREDIERSKMDNFKYASCNNGVVMCKNLSEYFYDLFKWFDIKSKVIEASDSLVIHYGLLVKGDNDIYFLDPINCLMSFQYNKPYYFYGKIQRNEKRIVKDHYSKVKELNLLYVKELVKSLKLYDTFSTDKKINSIKMRVFLSGGWKNFLNVKDDNLLDKKIGFINKNLNNIGNVNGAIERKLMYIYLMDMLFDHDKLDVLIWRNDLDNLYDVNIKIKTKDDKNEYIEKMNNDKYVLVKTK